MKTIAVSVMMMAMVGCSFTTNEGEESRLELRGTPPVAPVVLSAPNCTSNLVSVHLDNAFTDDERISIQTALDTWRSKLHGVVSFEVDSRMSLDQLHAEADKDIANQWYVLRQAPANSSLAGWTYWSGETLWATIYILPNLPQIQMSMIEPITFTVALHEMGHAMHLLHYTGSEPAVMNPGTAYTTVEPNDMAQWSRVWECPL